MRHHLAASVLFLSVFVACDDDTGARAIDIDGPAAQPALSDGGVEAPTVRKACVERAPTEVPRSPAAATALPCELLPPGFER